MLRKLPRAFDPNYKTKRQRELETPTLKAKIYTEGSKARQILKKIQFISGKKLLLSNHGQESMIFSCQCPLFHLNPMDLLT